MAFDISYVNTCGLLNYIIFLTKYSINLQQQRQENFVFEVGYLPVRSFRLTCLG